VSIYLTPATPQLEQGDLIDACPITALPESMTVAAPGMTAALIAARVVVVTQTCDLVQLKAPRAVVAVVYPAQTVVERGGLKPTAVRDQARLGKMFGWYFLPADGGLGLPESLIDLRDLHTVPTGVLEHLVSSGKRLCRLATPYREHLAQHFAVTYMRVAPPTPYETLP
jgi:hypothetical protein